MRRRRTPTGVPRPAWVAQPVEQRTRNAQVRSSNLLPGSDVSVTTAEAGRPTRFDVSASTVAFGSIASYFWDFGDGSTAETTSPTTTHACTASGYYAASVSETSSAGTSTTRSLHRPDREQERRSPGQGRRGGARAPVTRPRPKPPAPPQTSSDASGVDAAARVPDLPSDGIRLPGTGTDPTRGRATPQPGRALVTSRL